MFWLTAERNARGVIGHHVRALADRGRGLHLGVEGHAPVERRRLDLDRVRHVLGVEVLDHLLHADAVAAAEEVPPDHRFLGLCAGAERDDRGRGQRRPKMPFMVPSPPFLDCSVACARTPNGIGLPGLVAPGRETSDVRIRLSRVDRRCGPRARCRRSVPWHSRPLPPERRAVIRACRLHNTYDDRALLSTVNNR